MPVVRAVARDPAGQPVAGARVVVRLIAGPGQAPGFLPDGVIVDAHRAVAGPDGSWEMNLPANDSVVPAGTWYQVDQIPPHTAAVYRTAIVVPDDPGPHELVDLLASPVPAPPGVQPVTSVDGRTGAVALDDVYATADQVDAVAGDVSALPATLVSRMLELADWQDAVGRVDIPNDTAGNPDTGAWPNRWEWRFDGQLVFFLNEFGEPRIVPSAGSRVGWRGFAAHNQSAYDARSPAVPVWEIQDHRSVTGGRNTIASVNKLGDLYLAGSVHAANLTPGPWTDLALTTGVSGTVTDTQDLPTPPGGVNLNHPPQVRHLGGGRVESRGWFATDGTSISAGTPLGVVPAGWRPAAPFATITRQVSAGVTLVVWPDGTVATSSSLGGSANGRPVVFDGFVWEAA